MKDEMASSQVYKFCHLLADIMMYVLFAPSLLILPPGAYGQDEIEHVAL